MASISATLPSTSSLHMSPSLSLSSSSLSLPRFSLSLPSTPSLSLSGSSLLGQPVFRFSLKSYVAAPPQAATWKLTCQENSSTQVLTTSHDKESEVVEDFEKFKRWTLPGGKEQYDTMYQQSVEDPDGFWSKIAEDFYWHKKWDVVNGKVHEGNFDMQKGPIDVKWFSGGQTNICYNAIDRHVEAGRGGETAIIWEGNEPGQDYTITYAELLERVCQVANYLRGVGVKKGDFVTIYMPMVAELPIAMLACARIGAIHSCDNCHFLRVTSVSKMWRLWGLAEQVVFGGFSADALAQRIMDCRPKVMLTCSAVMRGTKSIPLKTIVDAALEQCSENGVFVEKCLVYDNFRAIPRVKTPWVEERDEWWQDMVGSQSEEADLEWMDAEDPLFLLYTSGSTGRPKGVLHTTGGYMVYTASTFKYAFDYRPGDIFWCTADCGWITGHSYVAYGPLLNGASVLVYEGVPNYPNWGRTWEIVERHKVTIFYTAPTAIRAQMRAGNEFVHRYSRDSLRVLGSVGEPINPAAWRWYYEVVGDSRCPISDTWWQTETGGFMITPLPAAWAQKPGSATLPFFGVQVAVVDEKGVEMEGECEGYLCIKAPWPSVFRTLYGDHPRYETTMTIEGDEQSIDYFAPFNGFYFSGDGCRRDKEGYYWLTGRVDDVINVSGHRIGTAEVESALVAHPLCSEAAVVGVDHEIKGQGIYAFVTILEGVEYNEELRISLINSVRSQIGPFAAPDKIHWAPGLPKTRSGKIMRRVLRKIAANQLEELGDISTLAEPAVVEQLIELKGK